jgi:hypothetical protein
MSRTFNPIGFLIAIVVIFTGLKIQDSEIERLNYSIIALDNRIILKMYDTYARLDRSNELSDNMRVEYSEILSKIDSMRIDY